MKNNELSHFDEKGRARMVDVSNKKFTNRTAIAVGDIYMSEEAFNYIDNKSNEKGDVLAVARIAAIQAVKQTCFLIPLCHQINLSKIEVEFYKNNKNKNNCITIEVKVSASYVTGVEMEALVGVNIGLLTIYDMLKAKDKSMHLDNIYLKEKYGGKSGDFINNYFV